MHFMVEHRVPDPNDLGVEDYNSYLLINTVGYYRLGDTSEGSPTIINRPQGRRDFLICYIYDGEMYLTIDDHVYTVREGVFVIPPHTKNSYNNVGCHGKFSIFWAHFTGRLAPQILREFNMTGNFMAGVGKIDELPWLFENMTTEMTLKKPGYEMIVSSLLVYVISLLGRKITLQQQKRQYQIDSRIQRALDYIHLHYGLKTSVSDLAAMVNLSPSHFSALFKEYTGLFPLKYILKYKVERACELMQQTDFPINQVAALVGFEDQFYFSRVFKKQTGMSPSEFSKHSKGEFFIIST